MDLNLHKNFDDTLALSRSGKNKQSKDKAKHKLRIKKSWQERGGQKRKMNEEAAGERRKKIGKKGRTAKGLPYQ